MEFIIQYIGWIVGIGLIILLAIIGYFVDKKDSKKCNVNNEVKNFDEDNLSGVAVKQSVINDLNKEDSIEQMNINSHLFSSDYDLNNVDVNNESDSMNKEANSVDVNNDIGNSLIANEFKNIEDVHMSLDDLEKKNYNEFLNNITGTDSITDNIVSNDSSITDNQDLAINNEVYVDNNINEFDSNIDSNYYIGVSDDVITDTVGLGNNDSSDMIVVGDNSESSYSIPELSNDEINNASDYSVNNNIDNDESMLDLYNDSLDEDIWRF